MTHFPSALAGNPGLTSFYNIRQPAYYQQCNRIEVLHLGSPYLDALNFCEFIVVFYCVDTWHKEISCFHEYTWGSWKVRESMGFREGRWHCLAKFAETTSENRKTSVDLCLYLGRFSVWLSIFMDIEDYACWRTDIKGPIMTLWDLILLPGTSTVMRWATVAKLPTERCEPMFSVVL